MASDPELEGKWHAPRSGRDVAARLVRSADGSVSVADVESGGELVSAASAQIRISRRVGSVPRRIFFPDQSMFVTRDNDGVDRLLGASVGRGTKWLVEMERFRPRLAIAVALIAVLALAVYRYAVPVLVEVAIAVTPDVVPGLMSSGALATLDEAVLSESGLEAERQQNITDGFKALAAHAPRGSDGYTLHFRKGGAIGPNALALPDGTIIITDELITLAGDDDDSIYGVLGHEIGHVDGEHSLRRLYRAAGITGLIILIGGDIGSGVEDVLIQGSALLSLSYSRDQERYADRYSIEIMHRAGRDPEAIARFFEVMRDRFGDTGKGAILTTHPATSERIEEARRYAREITATAKGGDG